VAKAAYVLREREDRSMSEISCCLDLAESNGRLHPIKSRLKERLYQLSISRDVCGFGSQGWEAMVVSVLAGRCDFKHLGNTY
jgi:hypothetical protein